MAEVEAPGAEDGSKEARVPRGIDHLVYLLYIKPDHGFGHKTAFGYLKECVVKK